MRGQPNLEQKKLLGELRSRRSCREMPFGCQLFPGPLPKESPGSFGCFEVSL